jgi:glycogen debranching enzyme GlgX/malto-oligosyltrehalose synthase
MKPIVARPGVPSPLGATWDGRGTNFAVYSEAAGGVDLCLLEPDGVETRVRIEQRTEFVWHVYLEDVQPGQLYAFRVDGPWEPKLGNRFNHHNVLLDPYAKAVSGVEDWSKGGFSYDLFSPERDLARASFDQHAAPYGVVVDDAFDWGNDAAPNTPLRKSILYETHVKGLTMRHPDVPPELRGTYAALGTPAILKHLVELGVTAVELLPVHHFVDDQHLLEQGLRNYWGYNSIAFLAPEVRYRAGDGVGDEVRQFKEMVRALHGAGLEVILDVVYNHTAEGNHLGPTLSFKGIDNRTYYRLAPNDPRFYFDYTGTGNTLNVHHPQTLRLIMDSLRYWVREMHVDGFRFDLASTLARSLHEVDRLSSFFTVLNQDPALANVKLIAEPWDMGEGGYQVGHFPVRWSEWNAEYRDAMRAFWRGDGGHAGEIGQRLTGSADLYRKDGRKPSASINFVAAHDGFTLRDLVSYEQKHNEANGEGNRDGADDNRSSNGGVEGDTDDARVNDFRARQQRNLLASLLFSRGTPMICGGDEIGRTQHGNNNAYCQDNETNWYDWELDEPRAKLHAFVRKAIALRRSHPLLESGAFASGETQEGHSERDAEWFRHDGARMTEDDWTNASTSSLALFLSGAALTAVDEEGRGFADDDLLLVLNASDSDLDFTLPSLSERGRSLRWQLLLDTADDDAVGEVIPDQTTPMIARSLKLFGRRAIAPAGIGAAHEVPTSTYRLQLHAGFRFADAHAITDYLDALGVGAAYSSPILKAHHGSTHGYDVVDHASLNPELGTREDFDAWTKDLTDRGMRYILDFVPNHMGVGGGENVWWNDVLEHGPSSVYADYFDIDWAAPTSTLKEKVLLPVLGGQFGNELEAKRMTIAREEGAFVVRYFESRYPTSPRSYRAILEPALARLTLTRSDPNAEELESIVSSIRNLPPASTTATEERAARARESEVMKRRLAALFRASPEVVAAVDATVDAVNDSNDKLEAFLLDQNHRLASWRVAGDEVNYRRFFDLNELAALRMEDPRVFADTHRFLFELIAEKRVTGLRLDHTDGLYDPATYFSALREGAERALASDGEGHAPLYVVVEKILERDEELPATWAIAGTTGYDFLAAVNGVWVDPEARAAFDEIHRAFAGADTYERCVYESKRTILRSAVSSEVQMLTHVLKGIADGERRARDFSFTKLLRAVEETLLAFPVYRSYVRPDGTRQPRDEAHVREALDKARRANPLIDRSVFEFLRSILLLEDRSENAVRFALRFQQLTSPVMAKGIEDTVMYRHALLLSNNEVGCDANRFATSPSRLHEHNVATLARWPLTLTATTTHDTKRSEDVRARIAALSEAPNEWRSAVAQFHSLMERDLGTVGGEAAPSRMDEYMFFQSVVGAYPFEGFANDGERDAFRERLVAYAVKAAHEAKLVTSWLAPDVEYDEAVARFVRDACSNAEFLRAVDTFVQLVLPHGASNSLAQLAIRLASPGVPDVYQGSELWDLSLVDPDNRRPVDFARRRAVLRDLDARGEPASALAEELVGAYRDGRIKLHVLRTGLRARKASRDLFLEGAYRVIEIASPHVVAFERSLGDARLVVIVPRLSRAVAGGPSFALGEAWKDETIDVGPDAAWTNAFTGESLTGAKLALRDVFRTFPVAWLLASATPAQVIATTRATA